MNSFIKDPQSTLDYTFEWSAWLTTGETISSATVTSTAGLTVAPAGKPTVVDPTKVTVWLAGGADGSTYPVTCSVSTTAGRVDDRTIRVLVMQR